MTQFSLEESFIDDEAARDYEEYKCPYEFLMSGRAPKVGQRIQSYVTLFDGNDWRRFSGIITSVGEEPSFAEWVSSSMWTEECDRSAPSDSPVRFAYSACDECDPNDPACWSCKILGGKDSRNKPSNLLQLQEKCKNVMGALHGQTVTTALQQHHAKGDTITS